ncbi:hypothetical protein [Phenylobacterium aquaticum]|uniref:hypothetical protein n=1 Tax=Phenylobacterium aquaticum TaxID=1763816 RepID=UPI001F5D2A1C|nr:hypothetical protein [Phenylobacterium aquaticum]MCI3133132.1 hypothetical protein [Phenylobacterium aquaticum]
MRPNFTYWAALAACAGILAVAWIMTDELAGWVSLPLLMALMAGGLLIAREKTAPGASVVAGLACTAHAGLLLAGGNKEIVLLAGYLLSAVVLAAGGLALRQAAKANGPLSPTADGPHQLG